MIYEPVNIDVPIQQGDIFRDIPRIDFSATTALTIINQEDEPEEATWQSVLIKQEDSGGQGVAAIVQLKPVIGIVITPDCDALRGDSICLCQIDDYVSILELETPPQNPKKWMKNILNLSRTSFRFFYLPPDPGIGFDARMAADYRTVLSVPRTDLEEMRPLRVARLDDVAREHFRETLGQFYRRYAYNEWYPLDKSEFRAYCEDRKCNVKPYPWQQ